MSEHPYALGAVTRPEIFSCGRCDAPFVTVCGLAPHIAAPAHAPTYVMLGRAPLCDVCAYRLDPETFAQIQASRERWRQEAA